MNVQFPVIDPNNIYAGMVEAIPATAPDVGWYAPEGVKTAMTNPPTDEPGKWRYLNNGIWEDASQPCRR